MNKIFVPFAHAKSIYEISTDFFLKQGVKTILVDLDNTLDSYLTKTASEKAIELKKRLNDIGITLVIVSNNTGDRVGTYADSLGVKYFPSLKKPFPHNLKKLLKENNLNKDEVIMIGDQTVTDIPCGNGAGLRTILTDKIVKEDQPTTRINRLLDRPIRKRLQKKNLIRDWSSI